MISEFHLLTEKVSHLAELARMLRRENAELRQEAAVVSAENAELSRRMEEAHARVLALLDKIPEMPGEPEAREAGAGREVA